jgi:hypothetical protein
MEDQTISLTRPQSAQKTNMASEVSEKSPETKYPTEIIDLPSKGYFYSANNPLSIGHVEVKMITAKEEDILTNANLIKKGQVLDKLLESVLINKKIKIEDFLVSDINAVYVGLRRLAYGDSYGPLSVTCPSCREENKEVVINLGELKYTEFDESKFTPNENNFEFLLPYSKKTLTFKLLTSKDETAIDVEKKVNSKLKLNTSTDLTTRFKYLITAVDGNSDKATIRKFVDEEFTSKDSFEFRKYIKEVTPVIDMGYNITCEHCNSDERIVVPMTAQFFWPDAGR